MVDLNGYDANDFEPAGTFEVIPAGEYKAVIIETEWKENSKKTGHFMEMKFQIVEGQYQNRTLFHRLNLDNPNDQAVQIAKRELSSICRAVGRMTPKDSAELHAIAMLIRVNVKKREDNGEDSNEVKGFRPVNGTPPASAAPHLSQVQPPSSSAPSNGGTKKAPWAAKK